MRRDSSDTATFAAAGIGAVTVACCAGMPAIAALVAGLSLAATLGVGAGLVALAGLVGATAPIIRARRRRGCTPGQGAEP